jgi:tripartite-type tricarboxylate transporter receptor subunit TctC
MRRLDLFRRSLLIAAVAAAPFCAVAQSDAWPARPVRIVSFLAPGGLSDTLARILAQHLEAEAIQVLKMDAEAFTAFVQAEIDRWAPIAKKVAAQPQ